jgi:flagellar biosynthesis/type III secretory pathway protein FliH
VRDGGSLAGRRIVVKDFRFINEAQREAHKAKEATAARARELAEQASGATEELKSKATGLKDQITEQAAGMSEIGKAYGESLWI